MLIKNVRIFDGISDHYFTGDVLIEGTKVAAVETSPIAEDPNTVVIDGADRVLVPGMSDAHVHLFGLANTLFDMMLASQSHLIASTLAQGDVAARIDDRPPTWRATPPVSRT